MINVTGSDTYPTNVAVPVDGDPVNAATLDAAPVALANRTTKLAADIAAIAMSDRSGVRRMREAATTTALAALTGMTTGDLAFVPGYGVYRYKSTSTLPATAPWVVAPGSGGGRWEHALTYILGGAGGLPVLDGSAMLAGDIGAATVKGTLSIAALANLFVTGNLTINAAGTLYVSGTETIAGQMVVAPGSLTTLQAGANVADASTRTQTGRTTVSGDGNVAWRLVTAPDADTVYGAVSGTGIVGADEVHVGAVTTGRVYSLTTTGAASGNRIRFVRTAGTNSIGAGGNWISTTGSANYTWIEYTYNGTSWVKSAWHIIP